MRATLSFNLPDEQEEFEAACSGMSYRAAFDDFDNYLRNRLKYEELSDPAREALQLAREKLHECMSEEDLA